MTTFSKPINEKNIKAEPPPHIRSNDNILSSSEYFNKCVNLKKYKLPQLKEIVKHYKLVRTGNKDVLISRIEIFFQKTKQSLVIQKVFRGWIVRLSFSLRGEAFKNRKICVNDSDFCTLEPLDEIPMELFFSFKDSSNFCYGFNISSLIQLMKNSGKINNPYNREIMDIVNVRKIIKLNNIIQIIFPSYKDEDKTQIVLESTREMQRTTITSTINPHIDSPVRTNLSNQYFYPRITNIGMMNTDLRAKYNKILQIRLKPVSNRMNDLFIEIDQLGNYTQNSWFSNLDRLSYIRFYRVLYDIWNFRGQLSSELKKNICPLFDPFSNIFIRQVFNSEITHEEIQFACLTIIENIIYSGIDDEHRKIGTLHVLSALTLVSNGARSAMPWLYESVSI